MASSSSLIRKVNARLMVGTLVVVLPMAATAQQDDLQWLERSKKVLEATGQQSVPEWLKPDPARVGQYEAVSKDIATRSAKHLKEEVYGPQLEAKGLTPSPLVGGELIVFASFSMPKHEMKVLLEEAGKSRATVVFRGLHKGVTTVPDMMKLVNVISSEFKSKPYIIMHPTLFRDYNVKEVPTLLYRDGDKVLVRGKGSVSLEYFRKEGEEGGRRDLGRFGETWDIQERDLIDDMKSRVAEIDWEGKSRTAWGRYWQNQSFAQIPNAKEDRIFEVDPTFRVKKDIKGPDSIVIARKGQLINPLMLVPMTSKLIIFDPTKKDQIAFARYQLANNKMPRAKLIVTRIDPTRGWEHLRELENELGLPVFLMQENLATRFHIQNIPATVQSFDNKWKVTEFGPHSLAELEKLI